jgi:hypothetical protein
MHTWPTGPVQTALGEIDHDAAVEAVPRRWARAILWLPPVGAVLIALTAASRPLFLALVQEDGPIEWLQFAFFLLASILFAVAAWRLARRGDLVGAALFALGAMGIFGIAGEEISWGQRIFDFGTPEGLAEVNHQDEFNVHNITAFPMQRIGNYMQLLLGGAGMLLPWLTRVRRPRIHARLLRLLSPPLFLTPAFALMFAYRAVRLVWDKEVLTVVKYGEWPEFCLALGLFVFALLIARRLRRPGPETTDRRGQSTSDRPIGSVSD